MQAEMRGLSESQVLKLQETWGENSLYSQKNNWIHILGRQYFNPFTIVLIGAAGIALVIGKTIDASLIGSFVMINSILGFSQEFRSERALKTLTQLIESTARVIRNGKEKTISARALVPGDLIPLREGDIIPADVTFIQTNDCLVDESILTGESTPVTKQANDTQANSGYSQTPIVRGTALATVIATGRHSRMGEINTLALETKHTSAFEKYLGSIAKTTLRIVTYTLLVFTAIHLMRTPQESPIELTLFLIALAISVIPEALQLVTTLTLANGSLRLAKHNVLVKKLTAIEDLGSIEVLCVDKTGTLTQNHMKCVDIYGKEGDVLFAATMGCVAKTGGFDGAIWEYIPEHLKQEAEYAKTVKEEPFSASKRYSAIIKKIQKQQIFIMRGAPEALVEQNNVPEKQKRALLLWAQTQGKLGHRVLAFAQGTNKETAKVLGALAFADPLKPDVPEVIHKAKRLGIEIKIISGDAPEVTGAIAVQTGIIRNPSEVITEKNFFQKTPKEFNKIIKESSVFARISPETKHRILQTISKTHTVGFLGEGVNDAPALRAAHIGIVVKEACDVARAAADIILREPDIRIMIDGIQEGRRIFANTTKYARATLTSNFGNFFALLIASFFVPFLPMTAVQILLINLLSDFPMIAIANDNVDPEETKRPRGKNLSTIAGNAALLGSIGALFNLVLFFTFKAQGIDVLQTNWFIGAILMELFFLFSIRSTKSIFFASSPSRTLLMISIIAGICTILLPYSPLKESLHFTSPSMHDLGMICIIVLSYGTTNEIVKRIFMHNKQKQHQTRTALLA